VEICLALAHKLGLDAKLIYETWPLPRIELEFEYFYKEKRQDMVMKGLFAGVDLRTDEEKHEAKIEETKQARIELKKELLNGNKKTFNSFQIGLAQAGIQIKEGKRRIGAKPKKAVKANGR
jgi:hypothetical protein